MVHSFLSKTRYLIARSESTVVAYVNGLDCREAYLCAALRDIEAFFRTSPLTMQEKVGCGVILCAKFLGEVRMFQRILQRMYFIWTAKAFPEFVKGFECARVRGLRPVLRDGLGYHGYGVRELEQVFAASQCKFELLLKG